MAIYDWREEVGRIAADTTSGSQAICLKAAEILVKLVDAALGNETGEDIAIPVEKLCRELERVKPAMAGLYTLTADVMQALETAKENGNDVPAAVRRVAVGFRSRLLSSNSLIAANAEELLPANACVATLSHSGTVGAVLKLGREKGKVRRVLISEGRPAYEGRIFASWLAEAHIPVSFVADGALPGIVKQCDIMVVGGDALCPSGLINKAGTFALALAAKHEGKDVVACIGTEKIIPFNIPEHYLREDHTDLWEDSPTTTQVINRIFEYTPLDLIDHLVTEDGVRSGENIPDVFASLEINPYLPGWL